MPGGGADGVKLTPVYSHDPDHRDSIDIIAVHGLDTKSPDTWLWKPDKKRNVQINWLSHDQMLPTRVKQARIFTCDWPSGMFVKSGRRPLKLMEVSRQLEAAIKERSSSLHQGQGPPRDRPIVFIASCLGGIVLIQTLVEADPALRKATRGIVFLATPFRGTSFQDVASWAERSLKTLASSRGQRVNRLLSYVKGPSFDLSELRRKFTDLSIGQQYDIQSFYETRTTNLYAKFLPLFIARLFAKPKTLVDMESATLDLVCKPLALERRHVLMNKFGDPDESDYQLVAGTIERLLDNVRQNSPLAKADEAILLEYQNSGRLQITRLSGDELSMDQCFVNLALVQQKRSDDAVAHGPSNFSLAARLRTETPEKQVQVRLEKLFSARAKPGGGMVEPRRILIRGRAGIGKTTLCKRMVHNFIHRGTWNDLFERLLWIPLRNLKNPRITEYNLENVLCQEFFSQASNGHVLAREVWRSLEATRCQQTLFILDGLDEIYEGLDRDNEKHKFLRTLLDLPNVIITSRPTVNFPHYLGQPDLELETLGFYPNQVQEYLSKSVQDQDQLVQINSFIESNGLIESLVRIPIQLDAICFTWKESGSEMPQTMTAVYEAIEQGLWKKDIPRLRIRERHEIQDAFESEIVQLIEAQRHMLEAMAFSGLFGETTEFDFGYRNRLSVLSTSRISSTWNFAFANMSFLRTSDTTLDHDKRSYHFLHLTFQEYFAARYFVRHWDASRAMRFLKVRDVQPDSIEPLRFLQTHKYAGRYDIFWRFVCGLCDRQGKAANLFGQFEEEPRDRLGLTHQRLIMHGLNEVSDRMEMREQLERNLSRLMEAEEDYFALFSLSKEFSGRARSFLFHNVKRVTPEFIISFTHRPQDLVAFFSEKAISAFGPDGGEMMLQKFREMSHQPPGFFHDVLHLVEAWDLADMSQDRAVVVQLVRRQAAAFPDETLEAVAAMAQADDDDASDFAFEILGARSDLSLRVLKAIVGHLKEKTVGPAWVSHIFSRQAELPDEILIDLTDLLAKEGPRHRLDLLQAMGFPTALPPAVLEGLVSFTETIKDPEEMWEKYTFPEESKAVVRIFRSLEEALPEEVIEDVISRVNHDNRLATSTLIQIMCRENETWSRRVVDTLLQWLGKAQDSDIKVNVFKALSLVSSLPDDILAALEPHLDDEALEYECLQCFKQTKLSSERVSRILIPRLEHDDYEIRDDTVRSLVNAPAPLSEAICDHLITRLSDKQFRVRGSASWVLSVCAPLPSRIVGILIEKLRLLPRGDGVSEAQRRSDIDISSSIKGILEKHSQWSPEQVDAFFSFCISGADISFMSCIDWLVRRDIGLLGRIPLNAETAEILANAWFKRSSYEHLACRTFILGP